MNYEGNGQHEFSAEGQQVHKDYYLAVLRPLRKDIRQKIKDLFENNSYILHHDNAPSPGATILREFLTKEPQKENQPTVIEFT